MLIFKLFVLSKNAQRLTTNYVLFTKLTALKTAKPKNSKLLSSGYLVLILWALHNRTLDKM